MIYRILICSDCRRRAMCCICTSVNGVPDTWQGLKSRAVEVEAQTPEDAARNRSSLIAWLREQGHDAAANALTFHDGEQRVIDRLLNPDEAKTGRRATLRETKRKAKAVA